jgi:hypothetical protein
MGYCDQRHQIVIGKGSNLFTRTEESLPVTQYEFFHVEIFGSIQKYVALNDKEIHS